VEIYTVGFTKKTASQFFETLKQAEIKQLMDIRLNNVSQLAGFAKRDDLTYFLQEICGATYRHELALTPTQEMLATYKKHKGSWQAYERDFLALLAERQVELRLDRQLFAERTVLLCSEATPEHCHRRLVAEYLRDHWGDIEIKHL
jgi:uncharacterized protein (DUF488 family)